MMLDQLVMVAARMVVEMLVRAFRVKDGYLFLLG